MQLLVRVSNEDWAKLSLKTLKYFLDIFKLVLCNRLLTKKTSYAERPIKEKFAVF